MEARSWDDIPHVFFDEFNDCFRSGLDGLS